MLARCDKCETTFDSHDGGTICQGHCKQTFCPKCEETHFPTDEKGFSQDVCRECQAIPDYFDLNDWLVMKRPQIFDAIKYLPMTPFMEQAVKAWTEAGKPDVSKVW
jgi:hypothetical protein